MRKDKENGKKRTWYKNMRGYMTLEAAFIIPWTVFLFVFLIYVSFYLYDKCVLFQDAYMVCFRASVQKEENGVSEYLSAHMETQFGKKYFGTGTIEKSAQQSDKEVRVHGECSVKVPFPHFLAMPQAGGWQIQTEAKAQIINPAQIIRKCRMAENVVHFMEE
ncbi:MAG: hypothetical protein HDR30_01795 [Lachnospiraceae bacterium]|nr:hypothetical protein [Lachnospiraceae bacterium]